MTRPLTVTLIATLSCALTSCFGVKQPLQGQSRGLSSTTSQKYQSSPTQTKTRRALLIANSDYQKKGDLNGTPLRDVKVMARELSALGYQVDVKENVTNVGLRDVIGDFSEMLSERDEVFFHYAGHGIEIGGEAMLLGVDFSARDKRDASLQGFSVSSVVSQMSRSSKAVVVIDACRDNPFTRSIFRGGRADQGMLSSSSTIEAKIERGGVYVVFSTLKGERALNGGELSPFVQAFQGVVRDHASESVTEVFSNHMQRRLLKEGQELVTRTFGVWSFYALKRPDASCPAECRPGCQVACISMFNAQAQEIERLKREKREFAARAQARASASAAPTTPITSRVNQAPPRKSPAPTTPITSRVDQAPPRRLSRHNSSVSMASKPSPRESPMSTRERTGERREALKEIPRPSEMFRRKVEAGLKAKPHGSEQQLVSLIQRTPDNHPTKPFYLERLAKFYWKLASDAHQAAMLKEERCLETSRITSVDRGRCADERVANLRQAEDVRAKAIEVYKYIVMNFPNFENIDQILFVLGFNFQQKQQYEDAKKVYTELIQSYPDSKMLADAIFSLADSYFATGDISNSAQLYTHVINNFPKASVYPYSVYKLGWCYYNQTDFQGALNQFIKVIKLENKVRRKKNRLGLKKEAQRDMVRVYVEITGASATAGMKLIKKYAPKRFDTLSERLADLYAGTGQFDKSNKVLKRLIAHYPKSYRVVGYKMSIVDNFLSTGLFQESFSSVKRLVSLWQSVKNAQDADPRQVERDREDLIELIDQIISRYPKATDQLQQLKKQL